MLKTVFVVSSLFLTSNVSALTFETTSKLSDEEAVVNLDPDFNPISGIEIEASGTSFFHPPAYPSVLHDRYLFGYFWSQHDFNQDGHLDFIYTGTMRPTNENWVGKNTGGTCGGDECEGEMPGPSLFLNDGTGNYVLSDELMVDERKTPGQSLSRQNLVADFNGDGRLDLFIADTAVGTHKGIRDSYFLSQPDGSWLESSRTHLSDANFINFDHGAAVGDIDNDGDIDVVLTDLNRKVMCWLNQGEGRLKLRKCGPGMWAAIELADMNGDGFLDLVAGGDDYEKGWGQARILLNNGKGRFKNGPKLPKNKKMPHIPELSVWDLDGDGDKDIVLSRVAELYVGTTVDILENKGDFEFVPQSIPIVEAPEDYVPVHEGNEWNNFVENILFKDLDDDGDFDIILVGHGSKERAHKVFGSVLINEGAMSFRHIPNGETGNPIELIKDIKFVGSKQEATWLDTLKLTYTETEDPQFEQFTNNIPISSLGGSVVAARGVALDSDIGSDPQSVTFIALIDLGDKVFEAEICANYWDEFDFLGVMVGVDTDIGFGGSEVLKELGVGSCGFSRGFVGAWQLEEPEKHQRVKAILNEVNKNGKALIMALPQLSDEQKSKINEVWF